MSSVKEAARSIVDNLPEQATWVDLMYELYVKLTDIPRVGRKVPEADSDNIR